MQKLKRQHSFYTYYRNRLLTGLFKLSEANSLVGTMQTELKELGPQIEEKAKVRQGVIKGVFLSLYFIMFQ